MRILLDAYFDNNFGDDLFFTTILNRYPEDLFYVFWNNPEEHVLRKVMQHSNLVFLPKNCELHIGTAFDGYIMIGGDVLPDGIDYSRRIDGMRTVKENGGFVAMLGFSLYGSYGEKTQKDLQTMAELADSIVVRDKFSAARFRELVPNANVTESTDMAFTAPYASSVNRDRQILGIAPRRKLYSTDQEHTAFCTAMASLADSWLKNHPDGMVRFLALSTGEYDDRVTSEDIRALMANADKTEIAAHTDTVPGFLERVRACTAMVPTRFHALVFALIYKIPFVPVPYEIKVTQLLDEIGYSGIRIPYGERISEAVIAQAAQEVGQDQVNAELLANYLQKAEAFFTDSDRLVQEKRSRKAAGCEEGGCFLVCPKIADYENAVQENARLRGECEQIAVERDQFKRDKDYLSAQIKELEAWVQSLQTERNQFDEALRDLSEKYNELRTKPLQVLAKRIRSKF